jgi:hypothetical protein
VENVVCGIDNCAVIVEDLTGKVDTPKKKKKSQKRTIKKSQMITNPEDLKMLSESRIVSKDPNEQKPERKPLSERMREKWHNTLYSEGEQVGKGPQKGLEKVKEEASEEKHNK